MNHITNPLIALVSALIIIFGLTITIQLKQIGIQGLEKLEIFEDLRQELATLNAKFVTIENDGMVFDGAWNKNHKNSMKKITKKPEGLLAE